MTMKLIFIDKDFMRSYIVVDVVIYMKSKRSSIFNP